MDQANYDGNMMIFFIFMPVFLYELLIVGTAYTLKDVLVSTLATTLISVGTVIFSKSLTYGTAGSSQAIINCNTIVQTVLTIILLG